MSPHMPGSILLSFWGTAGGVHLNALALLRRLALHRLRRQVRKLGLIRLLHARLHPMLGEFPCEQGPDLGRLVGIVDLIAADAAADPGGRHTLRVADERDLVLEGEIARPRRPGVEVLMEPLVGRDDQRADLPVVALWLLAFLPHQREALAGEDDHVRARAVAVRLLVGADRELRDVARHRAFRHIEADVATAGAALL